MTRLGTGLLCLCVLLLGESSLFADDASDHLGQLYDHIAADLKRGQPLVVQVHVPLCDNQIIPCGNRRLGDGDSAKTNLYWATSGGFVGWFNRRKSGWRQVARLAGTSEHVVEVRVWRRRITPGRSWRRRGVVKPFSVYVVAYAWRGVQIDRAVTAFVDDLYGADRREIRLAKGESLAAGGAAHLVGYVGHNRWMDIPKYDWPAGDRRVARKGFIAVACITEDYLAKEVSSPRRVPLLLTTSLLFAGAHSFEGAVSSFVRGGSLAKIRRAAIKAYATGQDKTVRRVGGAFTNPSDRRWVKRED